MEHNYEQKGMGSNLLKQVHEGMKVYDREGREIGTVERIYLGDQSEVEDRLGTGPATPSTPGPVPGEGTWVNAIGEGLSDDDDIPEVIRARLLTSGFFEVDTSGIFSSDRYVMPEQIASVDRDRVQLSVREDELIED